MNRQRLGLLCCSLLSLAWPDLWGQTALDLSRQGKNVDFAEAPRTRPTKIGPNLPASCQLGDLFFKTSATPGQNLYACTDAATGTWTMTGGSPPVMSVQLADLRVERTSDTVLTINPLCSVSTPCNYRIGREAYSITAPATVSINAGSGPGTAYVYLTTSGLKVGVGSGTLSLSCSAGCTTEPASGFPLHSIPLFIWGSTSVAGAWDQAGQDVRGLLYMQPIEAGAGLIKTVDTSGITEISLDPSVFPRYFSGPGAPTMACTAGRDRYLDTVTAFSYDCVAANSWRLAAHATNRRLTWASRPNCEASNTGQVLYPADASGGYLGFCDGSSWKWVAVLKDIEPPSPAASWMALNGASVTDQAGRVTWTASSANGQIQGAVKAVPSSTPYSLSFGVKFQAWGDEASCGVLWTNGTSPTAAAQTLSLHLATTQAKVSVHNWSSISATGVEAFSRRSLSSGSIGFYFRIADNGTERSFQFSLDGLQFDTLFTTGRSTPFTPTHAGVFCRSEAGLPFYGQLFDLVGF